MSPSTKRNPDNPYTIVVGDTLPVPYTFILPTEQNRHFLHSFVDTSFSLRTLEPVPLKLEPTRFWSRRHGSLPSVPPSPPQPQRVPMVPFWFWDLRTGSGSFRRMRAHLETYRVKGVDVLFPLPERLRVQRPVGDWVMFVESCWS